MASDVYLQIDGIKGESQEDAHKDWIACSSVHWGVMQPRSACSSPSNGHTAKRCELDDIMFHKLADLSSPILMQSRATSMTIPKAKFMLSTVTGLLCAQPLPLILQDPILGLRYETATTHFAPFPSTLRKDCPALDEGGNPSRAFFIFAGASDASGRVYYLLNGYHVQHRLDDMRFPRYAVDEYAPIIMLQHLACVITDHEGPDRLANENFTEEYSRDIQQRLMIDYANRLVAAYGGKEKLRIELLNQYVDVDTLPEALRHAFKNLRLTK